MNRTYEKSPEWLRYFAVLLCLLTIAASMLPILSVFVGGELVYGDIAVRTINLVENTAVGIVPLLMPVILISLLFLPLSMTAKIVMFYGMVLGNAVCYCCGVRQAYQWLTSISDEMVAFQVGLIIYAISTLCAESLIFCCLIKERKMLVCRKTEPGGMVDKKHNRKRREMEKAQ